MSVKQNPTILFVPGAWHSPRHFERVSNLLGENGFECCCPALASVGGSNTMTMYDDAAIIRAELDKFIVVENKEVIVILHSYGGVIGTQAVHASLSRRNRKAAGLLGGVISLVYMTAYLLPVGEALVKAVSGTVPAAFGNKDGFMPPPMPEKLFYNDLPNDEKTYYSTLLQNESTGAFITPLTYAAWQHHPVSYLFCKNDQIVSLEKQQQLVADSGIGSQIERYECNAGHSPYLSQPQVIVDMVVEITEQSRKT